MRQDHTRHGYRLPVLTAAIIALTILSTSDVRADCSTDQRSLEAELQQVNARASSLGICRAAQALERIYLRAADFHRRCVPGRSGEAQAREYQEAASQARATASQACG